MLSKSVIVAALVGSAAAFTPSIHMGVERRDLVQGGAAAAAAVPFLGSVKPADAFMQKNSMAPVITVFDHTGCSRRPAEYKGPESGDADDERLVKVAQTKIVIAESTAAKALNEFISFKGISMESGGSSAPAPAAKSSKAAPAAKAAKAAPAAEKKEEKKGGFGFFGK